MARPAKIFVAVVGVVGIAYVLSSAVLNRSIPTDTDSAPVWSPQGDRIAFHSTRDGNTEIYVMNPDGTGIERVTSDPGRDAEPAWSPDGRTLVFTSMRDGLVDRTRGIAGLSNEEIYTVRLDTRAVRRLTNQGGGDLQPSWSPDGATIAFVSTRDGSADIFLMDADGGHLRNLTHHPAADFSPAWSPDGAHLAFWSDRDGDREIYVMERDGSNLARLTHQPGPDFAPAWSPDGTRVAFVSRRNGNVDVFVVNRDGSGLEPLISGPSNDILGSWSPDGASLVVSSDREAGNEEVFLFFWRESRWVRLTHN